MSNLSTLQKRQVADRLKTYPSLMDMMVIWTPPNQWSRQWANCCTLKKIQKLNT